MLECAAGAGDGQRVGLRLRAVIASATTGDECRQDAESEQACEPWSSASQCEQRDKQQDCKPWRW